MDSMKVNKKTHCSTGLCVEAFVLFYNRKRSELTSIKL